MDTPRQGERGFRHYTRQAFFTYQAWCSEKPRVCYAITLVYISFVSLIAFWVMRVIELSRSMVLFYTLVNIVERVESCFKRRDVRIF